MNLPIIDLHCDLLAYLEIDKQRTPYDQVARCSIPQLHQGGVKVQTLAIFTQTEPKSVEKGLQQARIYQNLPVHYPKDFSYFLPDQNLSHSTIALLLAFENASGFCNDSEPLQDGLKRLNQIIKDIAKPLYVSLTWNTENRFGGGATTPIGLKQDGKALLELLDHHHIAIDLSHASDALAYDILDYIEGAQLTIPVMASHSNARTVSAMPRNLPDEIAKEIFRRKGMVGLNLYRHFIGTTEDHIIRHIAHWLELGGENHIGLGTDFFYDADVPSSYRYGKEVFFKDYQDASCYERLLAFIQKELKLTSSCLEKFAYRNALNFIQAICLRD